MIVQQVSVNDLVIIGSTVIFALVTVIFAVVYYKKIFYVKAEYNDAKSVIHSVILTFRRRQDEYDEKLTHVTGDVERLHTTTENLTEQNNRIERMVDSLITSVKSTFTINKKVVERVEAMTEEIGNLSKMQQNMQKQLTGIEERTKTPEPVKVETLREEKSATVQLTETENQIVQFLLNEGPKTAPEVEKKIEKTREHTARLMKKLWQEGFIERDTHRIPFIYRANEKLKERPEARV